MVRRAVVLAGVVAALLLAGACPLVAGAADGASASARSTDAANAQSLSSDASIASAQSEDAIVETAEHRLLPDQPARAEVVLRYSIPDDVVDVNTEILRGQYDVVATDGFERAGDGSFEWDGATDEPSVTIRHDLSESFRSEEPGQQYVGGTQDWAVLARPQTSTGWRSGSDVGLEFRYTVDGEGRAGQRLAFLGPHEVHQRTVDGERLTLVVPDAADLASSPDEILDALAHASDRLRVGQRNDEALFIATPTNGHDWSPPGLSLTADGRVVDEAAVDERVDVWTHEYVHARQNRDHFDPETDAVAEDAKWFVEGSADYYAALTSLEQGRIDFATFRDVLERGSEGTAAEAVLAEPATWGDSDANYKKGALVAAALDREIRAASDGTHTLQDVLRDWNRDETFDAGDLEAAAAEYGDQSVRQFVRDYTRTDATPAPLDQQAYAEEFDVDAAQFDYSVASEPALEVVGPHRSGGLPQPLVTGETVASTVRVENVGDVGGRYRAVLSIAGDLGDEATGSLAPGESETVRLEHTVNRTGDFSVVAGGHAETVRVRAPAGPGIRAEVPQSVVAGESFEVSTTVRNTANRPAVADVELRADDEVIGSQHVALGPNETTTLELAGRIDEPGEYDVGVGGDPVSVEVREATIVDQVPGFGLPAAVLALLVAVVALGRRA